MKIVYHPDAEEELLDAVRFYQQRVVGLGERFLREFDARFPGFKPRLSVGLPSRATSAVP